MWPWDALCATLSNVDVTHSEIFNYTLRAAPSSTSRPKASAIEALWWKQESKVTGFVSLTNISPQPLSVNVHVIDSSNTAIADHSVTVISHGTTIVLTPELSSTSSLYGGVTISYSGLEGDIIVNGGLEDPETGYSANIPLAHSPAPPSVPNEIFAELGLMTGAADPMMAFPAGTVFSPYSLIRNPSSEAASVTPTMWWMDGASPHSAKLQSFVVSPSSIYSIDLPGMLKSAGLGNFNGSVNLVLNIKGPTSSLILTSGSVDRKNTYVFSVPAIAIRESVSKSLSYWSTGNGDDTMISLWNPTDEPQAFVLKLFFSGGGTYSYPIRMNARVTTTFNLSEIITAGVPDVNGNTVPSSIHEGSAMISGSQAENEHILLVMDAGTYNVKKATCGLHCVSCNGATDSWVDADPFFVPIDGSDQLTFTSQYNTGHQYDLTSFGTWTSSSTPIATVNAGLVSGKSPGTFRLRLMTTVSHSTLPPSAVVGRSPALSIRVLVEPATRMLDVRIALH